MTYSQKRKTSMYNLYLYSFEPAQAIGDDDKNRDNPTIAPAVCSFVRNRNVNDVNKRHSRYE